MMNEQDKVVASQRVVELSTRRELTDDEQTELLTLREQLAATPINGDDPEEDFINPLITNSNQ